jgi:hypothetical protein
MSTAMKPLVLPLTVAFSLLACAENGPPVASPAPPSDPGLVAFATVQQVLQHPRCQNCHPAGDAPLQGDDGHVHAQNVHRGKDGHGNVGEQCATCHGPANPPSAYGAHVPPGSEEAWHMPAEDAKLVFEGVAPRALCEQIKDPTRNGGKDMAALRTHLDSPLVTWGWSPGFGRAPVPVPRDQFLGAWDAWARAGAPCPGGATASR